MWKLEMHVKMLEMGMKATAKDFRMHVFVGHGMVEWLYVLNELKGACVDGFCMWIRGGTYVQWVVFCDACEYANK